MGTVVKVDHQLKAFGDVVLSFLRRLRLPGSYVLPAKGSIYGWTIVATLVGLTLGMFLASTWQAEAPQPAARSEDTRQQVAATIIRLETEQADLKKAISSLRQTLDAEQSQAAQNKTTLSEISQELEAQKKAAGVVAVKGPGLRVTIDDSTAKTIPAGDDPNLYIVHEYQLRDIVNALWQSGAEAIAVNGERVVGTTSIYCVGSTIMVNATRLSPPYEIVAIGDSAMMDDWVNNPAVLKDLKNRIKTYGLQFKTVRSQNLTLPAYTGSVTVKYATQGSAKE